MTPEIKEEEIFNYLMTSEFDETNIPDQVRFMLLKFRYYYRIQSAKNEQLSKEVDRLNDELRENKDLYNQTIDGLSQKNSTLQEKVDSFNNKKLTWSERIKGKLEKDETEGL